MTERSQVYKCEVCGNMVEVLHAGAGELVCCGQPMNLLTENTVDAAKEKHVPVVEKTADGFKVSVGSVPHPMEEKHYIEWVELLVGDKVYRQFLKPGDKPEAAFTVDAAQAKARAYCNLHGLWGHKPMLSKQMEKAINAQINAELYSSYLYLAMCAHFESVSLAGMANWMRMQAQEELFHGMKMYDFVHERGGKVTLDAIAKPPGKWKTPLAVFTDVLAHEQKVTGLINNLVNLALDERDHATNIFLQWFVTEQVEEESSASTIVDKLKLIGNDANGLFVLDNELGQRVFTPPAAA